MILIRLVRLIKIESIEAFDLKSWVIFKILR